MEETVLLLCLYGGEVVLADRGLSERKGEGRKGGDILKGEPKYATTFLRYTISPATYFHHFLCIPVTVKGGISAIHNAYRLWGEGEAFYEIIKQGERPRLACVGLSERVIMITGACNHDNTDSAPEELSYEPLLSIMNIYDNNMNAHIYAHVESLLAVSRARVYNWLMYLYIEL